MSALMLIGVASGLSPMPKPIPMAIVAGILGATAPQPLLMTAALTAHFVYGGIWGGLFASIAAPVTVARGIGLGLFLWLLMQIVVLPWLGWGAFGIGITPAIAVATLVLHVVYGATFGLAAERWLAAVPSR